MTGQEFQVGGNLVRYIYLTLMAIAAVVLGIVAVRRGVHGNREGSEWALFVSKWTLGFSVLEILMLYAIMNPDPKSGAAFALGALVFLIAVPQLAMMVLLAAITWYTAKPVGRLQLFTLCLGVMSSVPVALYVTYLAVVSP